MSTACRFLILHHHLHCSANIRWQKNEATSEGNHARDDVGDDDDDDAALALQHMFAIALFVNFS